MTDVTSDQPVLKVVMATSGEAKFPSGSTELSETVISGFDTSVPDAFARGTNPEDEYIARSGGGFTGTAFPVAEGFRNSSQDQRLPALVESSASVGDWYAMWEPGFAGADGAWNLWGDIRGLAPNTEYTVVLARMATKVNGELDQNQVLLGRSVTDPDELVFLGGAPGGINPPQADFAALFPFTGDQNPVAVFAKSRSETFDGTCYPADVRRKCVSHH